MTKLYSNHDFQIPECFHHPYKLLASVGSAHLGVNNTFSGVIVLGLISKVLYLFSIGDDNGEDCLLIQVIT